jgi:hypothetical protein
VKATDGVELGDVGAVLAGVTAGVTVGVTGGVTVAATVTGAAVTIVVTVFDEHVAVPQLGPLNTAVFVMMAPADSEEFSVTE